MQRIHRFHVAIVLGLCFSTSGLSAQGVSSLQVLSSIESQSGTEHKPQSKTWRHGGRWWCVLDDASGDSVIFRQDGTTWSPVLTLGTASNRTADVVVDGGDVHILLHQSGTVEAEVWSLTYDPTTALYSPWSSAPTPQTVTLGPSSEPAETATMALDSSSRLWIAYDSVGTVEVRYSEPPYSSWSAIDGPLATGLTTDDICAVVALPTGSIGVFWSDQGDGAFGFRTRIDSAPVALASSWGTTETPLDSSLVDPLSADDHLNLATAEDGTLFAAVKTSLDASGQPVISFLIRRPNGTWDPAYTVASATDDGPDEQPTRPAVVWDGVSGKATVLYCGLRVAGVREIVYRQTGIHNVAFGPELSLMSESIGLPAGTLCDISTMKASVDGEFLVMASTPPLPGTGFTVQSVVATIDPAPRGFYRFDLQSDVAAEDSSGEGNTGAIQGGASRVPGVTGTALSCDGSDQYVLVSDSDDLDLTERITLAAWVRPNVVGTQYLVKKAVNGQVDGYELSLSANGRAFVRFNETASSNDFRVDAISSYPTNGDWTHLAATYDGATIRIYVDGVEEASSAATITIAENDNPLVIGAQSDGVTHAFSLDGSIDDVEVIGRALRPQEIACRAQALTADTVGLYEFEGTSTISVVDTSGEVNDGTILGDPQRVSGVYGQAIAFDGVDDHILIPHDETLSPSCRLSLAAWVRPETTGTQYLIKKAVNRVSDGFELALSSSGVPFARLNGVHSVDLYRVNSPVPYPTDGTTWMHLASVFDGSRLRLYVDGSEVADIPAVVDIRPNTHPVVIAAQSDGTTMSSPFQGTMDVVEILGRALTPEEIEMRVSGAFDTDFIRGDANDDGAVDIADAIAILSALFGSPSVPLGCDSAGDANDDAALDIADAIATLSHLFSGTGPLPQPFPTCGVEPTVDALSCSAYSSCP